MNVTVKTRITHNQLDSIRKTLRSADGRISYNSARRIATGYKVRVHVITGDLKASIHTVKEAPGKHSVVAGMPYASFEEYGTRYRPPHPALRPAVEAEKLRLKQELVELFHR
jgi:HK97 gp10 family phage protein